MVTISTSKRILCRTLLVRGEIMSMQVVDRTGEVLRIEPFSVETAATVFEPRPVAVISTDAVTDFLIDDIELLSRRCDAIPEINRYLISAGLYPNPGEVSSAVALIVI